MEFFILIWVDFLLSQIAKLDKIINLFCLVFLKIDFFVCRIFFKTDAVGCHCFYIIYSTKVSGFFISVFISFHSLNTLFTETNSSWLIYESIKVLEITTSIVFNILPLFNTYMSFYIFHELRYYVLFHLKDNFLFHLFF